MKYMNDKNFVLAVLICIDDLRYTMEQTAKRMGVSTTTIRYIYQAKRDNKTAVQWLAQSLMDSECTIAEWKALIEKADKLQKEQMIQFAKDALIKNDFGVDGLELQYRQTYGDDKP